MEQRQSKQLECANEQEQEELGKRIAARISTGLVCTLEGELGAGKTTTVRGVARYLGHKGAVKSPTYTLVETYELQGANAQSLSLAHFDLYRLSDPEELEYMGWRDYFNVDSVCFIEWPEKAGDLLPPADLHIKIDFAAVSQAASSPEQDNEGRKITLSSFSAEGDKILQQL